MHSASKSKQFLHALYNRKTIGTFYLTEHLITTAFLRANSAQIFPIHKCPPLRVRMSLSSSADFDLTSTFSSLARGWRRFSESELALVDQMSARMRGEDLVELAESSVLSAGMEGFAEALAKWQVG